MFLCTRYFVRQLQALNNVLGSGSYPSQLDQSHMRDDFGVHGDQNDSYNADYTVGGKFNVKIRAPPSTGAQPFGKPSQDDREHRINTGKAGGGRYDQYAPGSARGTDHARRSGPFDRERPFQFDQEYKTGRVRGSDDRYAGYHLGGAGAERDEYRTRRGEPQRSPKHVSQFDKAHQDDEDGAFGGRYVGYHPGSAGADRDEFRTRPGGPPGSPKHASQFDQAHLDNIDAAFGGQYKGHMPGSSTAPYEKRRGPPGLHAFNCTKSCVHSY